MGLKPFAVVSVDPGWLFDDALPGKTRGAVKNYRCMKLEDIFRFPLPPLQDNAMLFLWRVSAMQEEALQVVRKWGFVPKSEIVWQKLTKNGKPHFGMGHYVRASHETAIIAVRGSVKLKSKSIRSRFAAKMPVDAAGRYIHSAKPDEFYRIVETLVAGPYAEVFARKRRPGWTVFGDEVPDESRVL